MNRSNPTWRTVLH